MCVLDVAYGLPLVDLANCVSKLRVEGVREGSVRLGSIICILFLILVLRALTWFDNVLT